MCNGRFIDKLAGLKIISPISGGAANRLEFMVTIKLLGFSSAGIIITV
jgi:hypothetical protein